MTASRQLDGVSAAFDALRRGDGRPCDVALIVLDPDAAAGVDRAQAEVAVREAVAEANERLSRVEQIKRYEPLTEEWLPGGDQLTRR